MSFFRPCQAKKCITMVINPAIHPKFVQNHFDFRIFTYVEELYLQNQAKLNYVIL